MNQDIQASQGGFKSFTGRFYLTPPSASDDEDVAAILSHPTTRRYLQFIPEETSPEDARMRRESRAANQTIYDFNVYLKSGGEGKDKFAGMAGLIKADTVHKSCEMYMLVSPDLHRQGVALEAMHATLHYAFEELGMHRVAIGTAVDNLPMQGVLTAAKAPYEGCLRGAIVAGPGSWADIMLYGILETDWTDAVRPCLEGRMKSST
ncbi:hypothetical protein ONZ45_g8119 [Pleurotus djamor]|nr:hypothetical protein ONZ45_g8119 [Pleurotus djamor]